MQAPEWASFLSMVDGSLNHVPLCDLDQVLLKEVMAENRGLTDSDLKNRSREHLSATLTGCESPDGYLDPPAVKEDADDQLSEIASTLPPDDPSCVELKHSAFLAHLLLEEVDLQSTSEPTSPVGKPQGTGAGHAEGHGPRGTALPAPSAGTAQGAHATQPRGGGADAAGARAHTHAEGTRVLPEGQPDRAGGTHRPRGMAYQRARVRDTRTGRPATRSAGHAGREVGNRRDTTPGSGPSPPNRPRAPRTHGRGTAPAKAVVAHSATPQPLG